ncbi:MAG: membrane protein insertase YidC [Rhizobiales bacterium]|nr:membrane protein insertase YidC [Hyphomicrobiales bacterium]
MNENRNLFVAIGLSIMVLLGWQYLVVAPQDAKRRAAREAEQALQVQNQTQRPAPVESGSTATTPQLPGASAPSATAPSGNAAIPGQASIAEALKASERTAIATERLEGSINLTGGRIDDILLRDYREKIEDDSPLIRLFNPVGSTEAYYAETGFVAAAGGPALPNATTLWKVDGNSTLSVGQPVTLTYDNGAGLSFRRTFEIDENYLFTVTDSVANSGGEAVTVYPYGIVSRRGVAKTEGIWILHEGPIGVFGEKGLHEIKYNDFEKTPVVEEPYADRGWLGITDKYWAATLIPPSDLKFKGRFASNLGEIPTYQADFLSDGLTVAPGAAVSAATRLFAGAKETALLDKYQDNEGIERFELLIDWGWFYFLTKYLFYALDYLFRVFGNFGVAILFVTIGLKIAFFWFANRSYVSMSRMKLVQPRLKEIQERYKDDKPRQQQELMKLYREEKINPLAGCWPVLIQIPVFFSLYKVLYVTIEMRHAPFFGWIQDLAAPDPTSLFNLFGLIPIDLPTWLPVLGIWPLIMGVTMFIQMKLNPAPPDPTQQMIFNWMPVIFTFMLASFPAGLVIYWAWNNALSIIQQYVIMRRQGVDVDILGNVVETFRGDKKKPAPEAKAGKTGASDKS